jgi:hypothetical protein
MTGQTRQRGWFGAAAEKILQIKKAPSRAHDGRLEGLREARRVAAKVLDDRPAKERRGGTSLLYPRQVGAGADLQKPDYASPSIYRLYVDGEGF